MRGAIRVLVGAMVLIVSFVVPSAFSQEEVSPSNQLVAPTVLFERKGERFLEHAREFAEYRGGNDLDDAVALTFLLSEARVASIESYALFRELALYYWIVRHSGESERAPFREAIQGVLNDYARHLDGSITLVNRWSSDTKAAAIVTSAARMRDDLRETINTIKSIKLP